MTKHPSKGDGPDTSPKVRLPEASRYQRPLWHGPGVSVYAGRHPPDEWSLHEHPQTQATLVLSHIHHGIRVDLDGQTSESHFHTSGVIVIPANVPHALLWPDEGLLVKMYFSTGFIREVLGSSETELTRMDLTGLAVKDRAILHLAQAFVPLCEGLPPPNAHYPGSLANVFGTHLLWALFGPASDAGKRGELRADARSKFETHLQQHLSNGYRPASFARAAGVSLNHFHVLVRATYGKGLRELFRERQVLLAQTLLITTDEKVLDIALKVGFGSSSVMVTWFRKILRCTPADVRNARRKS